MIRQLISKSMAIAFLSLMGFAITLFTSQPGGAMGDLGIVVEKVAKSDDLRIEHCKYCGKQIVPGPIHSDAEKVMREKLQEALTDRGIGYRNATDKGRYINLLIYRFQERQGSSFSVDKPAGAGFHMHVMDGNTVEWTFAFDEDQQALSQNVLGLGRFFKRGGKWITVDELAGEGINKGLDRLLEVLP